MPRLLRDVDQYVSDAVSSVTSDVSAGQRPVKPETNHIWKNELWEASSRQIGSWVVVSNVEAANSIVQLSIEEEVRACFESVQGTTILTQ